MKFSQRRFRGFRESLQFDKKRILVAGKNSYSVHEFDSVKRELSTKLVEERLNAGFELVYADFLEDMVPKYVMLVINDTKARKSYLPVKTIMKSEIYQESIRKLQDESMPPPRSNTEITHPDASSSDM